MNSNPLANFRSADNLTQDFLIAANSKLTASINENDDQNTLELNFDLMGERELCCVDMMASQFSSDSKPISDQDENEQYDQ